jgi:hypothetical protein
MRTHFRRDQLPDPVPLLETRSPYRTESVVVDIPPLEAISVALPASEMRWDLEPALDDPYISDLELAVDVTIESRSYRALLQVALEKLADLQKRLENSQRANREYRTRERFSHDIHR